MIPSQCFFFFFFLKKSVDQFQRAHTILFQLTFTSTGLSVDLHLGISISFRRSSIYFRWEINIPCFDLVTSMPRKYFRLPKSFVSNSLARRCFKFCISPSSFLVKTISSTFIIKAASSLSGMLNEECMINLTLLIIQSLHSLGKPL